MATEQAAQAEKTEEERAPQITEDTIPQLFDHELLNVDVRHICRAGILELMRIGAGLSYKQLGQALGLPPIKVRRHLCGEFEKPRREDVFRIWSYLWERLPVYASAPTIRLLPSEEALTSLTSARLPQFLSVEEAARLLGLSWREMRRLISRVPEIGAIRINDTIRIPRGPLCDYIAGSRGKGPLGSGGHMTLQQAAALLRVPDHVLRYAVKTGRLRVDGKECRHLLISNRELARLVMEGTSRISDERDRQRRYRQKKREDANASSA